MAGARASAGTGQAPADFPHWHRDLRGSRLLRRRSPGAAVIATSASAMSLHLRRDGEPWCRSPQAKERRRARRRSAEGREQAWPQASRSER